MTTLADAGIVYPHRTVRAAEQTGLPLAIACAFLQQESSGGHNVFGHDPTIFVGAGDVTEAKYKAYLAERGPTGKGGMQGVGPMQLSWWSYQDDADKLGGCWRPLPNMLVGFQLVVANHARYGSWWEAAAHYNGGTNPSAAARRYADEVTARAAKLKDISP
jgi:hypothetical protein